MKADCRRDWVVNLRWGYRGMNALKVWVKVFVCTGLVCSIAATLGSNGYQLWREVHHASQVERSKADIRQECLSVIGLMHYKYGSIPQKDWDSTDRARYVSAKGNLEYIGEIPIGGLPELKNLFSR